MNRNQHILKKVAAPSVLIFPSIFLLSFIMHLHNPDQLLTFRLTPLPYSSDELFNRLIQTGGGSFVHAHLFMFVSIPFIMVTIVCLGYVLFPKRPLLSATGVAIGIVGTICLSGFMASWLSFSAISGVKPQYYDGAKAALAELTRMTGFLKTLTLLSFLSFIGMMLLSLGLLTTTLIPKWSPIALILGCFLIIVFWSLVNWMVIASIFIFAGLLPVNKLLKTP